jgi:hypothetical protein
MVLTRLKELVLDTIMTREHIDDIIVSGDSMFECTAQRTKEANMKSLKKFVRACLWLHGAKVDSDEEYEYEEEQEAFADEPSSSNASDTDDSDEFPTAATFAPAATATDLADATSNAPIGSGARTTHFTTATPTEPPTNVQATATVATTNAPPTNVQGTAATATTDVLGTAAAPSTTAADSGKKYAAQPIVTNPAETVIRDEGKTTD